MLTMFVVHHVAGECSRSNRRNVFSLTMNVLNSEGKCSCKLNPIPSHLANPLYWLQNVCAHSLMNPLFSLTLFTPSACKIPSVDTCS